MIPKIIHQYWDGELPEEYKIYSKKIQDLNPYYKYHLWNKNSVLDIIKDHPLRPYLELSQHPICSSDIARIILLDHLGGLYFDSDMLPNISIPEHLLIHDCFACYENEYTLGQTIANGAIGSVQHSHFISSIINEIILFNKEKVSGIGNNSWQIFGPRLWTKIFFDLYCRYIMVYPSWYFIPNHYNNSSCLLNNNGYIMNHIWNERYKDLKSKTVVQYSHGNQLTIIRQFKAINHMKS